MFGTSNRRTSLSAALTLSATALAACGGDSPTDVSTCDPEVNLFPTPVSDATSPFPDVDDSFLQVAFAGGFTFS